MYVVKPYLGTTLEAIATQDVSEKEAVMKEVRTSQPDVEDVDVGTLASQFVR